MRDLLLYMATATRYLDAVVIHRPAYGATGAALTPDEVPLLIDWLLETLTPAQRMEAIRRFCRHCGEHDPHHAWITGVPVVRTPKPFNPERHYCWFCGCWMIAPKSAICPAGARRATCERRNTSSQSRAAAGTGRRCSRATAATPGRRNGRWRNTGPGAWPNRNRLCSG